MQLNNLKQSWHELTDDDKIELIEQTNERRRQAFVIDTEKKTRKKSASKAKKAKRGSSRVPTSPEGLLKLMEKMTPEEKENFKLMINMNS